MQKKKTIPRKNNQAQRINEYFGKYYEWKTDMGWLVEKHHKTWSSQLSKNLQTSRTIYDTQIQKDLCQFHF